MDLNITFPHGLGDCANFAHILELYVRRGFNVNLHCADDKAFVFSPLPITRVDGDFPGLIDLFYPEPRDPEPDTAIQFWLYNKTGLNMSGPPLPDLGPPQDIWEELCNIKLDLAPFVPREARCKVQAYLDTLPGPVVLIHSMGNTFPEAKNIPRSVAIDLYKQLLDRFDGTLLLLDWDNRVPRLDSWRVRHLTDDWERIDVPTLVALMESAALLISIDSGPLHLARLTQIPTIGVFPTLNKYPGRVALPSENLVNIVPASITHELNPKTRILYRIVESPGLEPIDTKTVAEVAEAILKGPRYFHKSRLASDIQLQQFVKDWEKGHGNGLSDFNDRHRGFDILFRELSQRESPLLVVETGCIRGEEDWKGAGYSTYILSAFLTGVDGELISIDNNPLHCEKARQLLSEFRCHTIIHDDSVAFLSSLDRDIDALYLDSMDTEEPGQAEHTLDEVKAAAPRLKHSALVVFDDTVYASRRFMGSGSLAVPWLLERGWEILHSGYQTICAQRSRR